MAAMVDLVFLTVLGAMLSQLSLVFGYQHSLWPDALLIFSVFGAYFVLSEWMLQATIGKLLMGLRVVSLDGSRPLLSQIVIRNALRLFDALPMFYLVGAILIGSSPRRQRYGDALGRTVVVPSGPWAASADPSQLDLVVVLGSAGATTALVFPVLLFGGLIVAADVPGRFWGALALLLGVGVTLMLTRAWRYAVLTFELMAIVGLMSCTAGFVRYYQSTDQTSQVKANIERTVHVGMTERDMVAALRFEGFAPVVGEAEGSDSFVGARETLEEWEFLREGERYVFLYFPNVSEGLLCPDSLRAYLVMGEDGRLARIEYERYGDGCP